MANAPSFTDPAVLLDPYPAFAWLREHDPIHWAGDVKAWVITRHADVVQLFRDARLSANRIPVLAQQILQGGDTTPIRDYLRVSGDMMLMKDAADHHRLRVLGNRGFTPSALASWAPRVTKVIDELLDAIPAEGHFDIVDDLAEPMPATVIAEMFGIPKEDHGNFRMWADDQARFFGGTVRDPLADGIRANDSALGLGVYFEKLYYQRKQKPGDDLMSLFIAAEEAGKLTVDEVVNQCMLILIAGHVTTIDQLSNGVHALLSHEGEWARLAKSPEMIRAAVDETMRYDTAVTLIMRVVTEDVVLHGHTLKAGQLVFLALASANHDSTLFANPEKFDVTRTNNKHVAFGVGQHQCIGMSLARMELETAIRTLLVRYPKLRLDPDRPPVRKCESLTFRGFSHLPVLIS